MFITVPQDCQGILPSQFVRIVGRKLRTKIYAFFTFEKVLYKYDQIHRPVRWTWNISSAKLCLAEQRKKQLKICVHFWNVHWMISACNWDSFGLYLPTSANLAASIKRLNIFTLVTITSLIEAYCRNTSAGALWWQVVKISWQLKSNCGSVLLIERV